jgi:Phage integrase family
VLSGEQVERLLAAAPPSYRTLFLTAVSTGVRLGELRALRWADVDWNRDQPRLHVRRSVSKSGVFQVPKTKSSTRKIPIGPRLRTALLEHRMASRYKDDGDLIFPNANGAPLDGHNLAVREFKPALRQAGLPSIRFHDLRHMFATLLTSSAPASSSEVTARSPRCTAPTASSRRRRSATVSGSRSPPSSFSSEPHRIPTGSVARSPSTTTASSSLARGPVPRASSRRARPASSRWGMFARGRSSVAPPRSARERWWCASSTSASPPTPSRPGRQRPLTPLDAGEHRG